MNIEELYQFCCGSYRKSGSERLLGQLDKGVDSTASVGSVASLDPPASLRPMSELSQRYDVNWSPSGELGRGHFARVFRGTRICEPGMGTRVAAKRILRSACRTETLHSEIKALARLDHPNICRLFDVFFDGAYVVLILEYLGGGELFHRIAHSGAYSEQDAAVHFYQLSSALAYMHANNVVHRDLKPENLVLLEPTRDSAIKITDFGLSKVVEANTQMTTVCGTRAYSAPEINLGSPRGRRRVQYSSKVDVWSMGVILFVLLSGYHPMDPFGKASDDQLWQRICHGEWSFNDLLWQRISPQAKDLISRMIVVDVADRLSMAEVCAHPWFHATLPRGNLKSPSREASLRELMRSASDEGNEQDADGVMNVQ